MQYHEIQEFPWMGIWDSADLIMRWSLIHSVGAKTVKCVDIKKKKKKSCVLCAPSPPTNKYVQSWILWSGSILWAQMARGQRSEKAESPARGNEVYSGVTLLPAPSRHRAQLWSRITLQWAHQRVSLIWGVLPERTSLLSKYTASQIGTTLISHTHTHLWPLSQGPHWSFFVISLCYYFLNDLMQKSASSLIIWCDSKLCFQRLIKDVRTSGCVFYFLAYWNTQPPTRKTYTQSLPLWSQAV